MIPVVIEEVNKTGTNFYLSFDGSNPRPGFSIPISPSEATDVYHVIQNLRLDQQNKGLQGEPKAYAKSEETTRDGFISTVAPKELGSTSLTTLHIVMEKFEEQMEYALETYIRKNYKELFTMLTVNDLKSIGKSGEDDTMISFLHPTVESIKFFAQKLRKEFRGEYAKQVFRLEWERIEHIPVTDSWPTK